jgi:hypothetical protein
MLLLLRVVLLLLQNFRGGREGGGLARFCWSTRGADDPHRVQAEIGQGYNGVQFHDDSIIVSL